MVSFGALLAYAVALRWILSAGNNGVFDSSKADTTDFYVPAVSGPVSQLGFSEKGGEECAHSQSGGAPRPHWMSRNQTRISTVHKIGKVEPIHIVCLGECRPSHFLSDEILDIPGFKVSTALDHQKLFSAMQHVPALVLIHDSLHPVELEDACRNVRHKWPHTRILVIHDGEEFLEDSLYDDRIRPDVNGKDLIARILFLVQTLDLWKLRAD